MWRTIEEEESSVKTFILLAEGQMGGSSFTVIMNPRRREGLEGAVTSDQ